MFNGNTNWFRALLNYIIRRRLQERERVQSTIYIRITTYAYADFYHRREKKRICMCNVNISHRAMRRECSSYIYSRAWKRDLRAEDSRVFDLRHDLSISLRSTFGIGNIFWENRSINKNRMHAKLLFSHKIAVATRANEKINLNQRARFVIIAKYLN